MKLKIFSDRNYLLPGAQPAPILYPFWRDLYPAQLESWLNPYDRYMEIGDSLFEMACLEDADVAILPIDWRSIRGDSWRYPINKEAQSLAIQFAELVKRAKKPLIVFFGSECSDEKLPIDALVTFRQSVYHSIDQSDNRFVLPFFCEDFVEQVFDGQLPIRQKHEKPVVGFCGFARPLSLKRKLQTPVYHAVMLATQGRIGVYPYKGEALRTSALNLLAQNSGLESNFIIRQNAIFFEASNPLQKKAVRMEYVQNIATSDYIFCCRGSGNYSNRLYEVLSCGKIPIFLDTDCELPWDSLIDWKQYCVWIEEKDLPNIAEKVIEFHNRLSPQEFLDLQHSCRQLWQNWLSAEGFYRNVSHYLLNHLLHKAPAQVGYAS